MLNRRKFFSFLTLSVPAALIAKDATAGTQAIPPSAVNDAARRAMARASVNDFGPASAGRISALQSIKPPDYFIVPDTYYDLFLDEIRPNVWPVPYSGTHYGTSGKSKF